MHGCQLNCLSYTRHKYRIDIILFSFFPFFFLHRHILTLHLVLLHYSSPPFNYSYPPPFDPSSDIFLDLFYRLLLLFTILILKFILIVLLPSSFSYFSFSMNPLFFSSTLIIFLSSSFSYPPLRTSLLSCTPDFPIYSSSYIKSTLLLLILLLTSSPINSFFPSSSFLHHPRFTTLFLCIPLFLRIIPSLYPHLPFFLLLLSSSSYFTSVLIFLLL